MHLAVETLTSTNLSRVTNSGLHLPCISTVIFIHERISPRPVSTSRNRQVLAGGGAGILLRHTFPTTEPGVPKRTSSLRHVGICTAIPQVRIRSDSPHHGNRTPSLSLREINFLEWATGNSHSSWASSPRNDHRPFPSLPSVTIAGMHK